MSYEIITGWRTLRKEGLVSLASKVRLYFRQMALAREFARLKRPPPENLATLVEFSFQAAGGLVRPAQVKSEIVALCEHVKELQPRIVVEIGTATGGTLFLWCAFAHPEATLVSIDLPGGIHGGGYPYWRGRLYRTFAQPAQRLVLLRGNSHEQAMVARLRSVLSKRDVDFLFIDGDHTYEGVKRDFQNYAPFVRKGGLIAFHDICQHPPEQECHVDEFWNGIKKGRPHQEFIENPAQGWGGIGVLHGE